MSFWKKPDGPHVTALDNPLTTTVYPGQGQYSIDIGAGGGGGVVGSGKLTSTFVNIGTTDHIIQGQMLVAHYSIDIHEAQFMDDDHLKRLLIKELMEQMYQGKYIEFTKQNDPTTNMIKARARIYVTPDSNVKILRTYQNDK